MATKMTRMKNLQKATVRFKIIATKIATNMK